MRNDMIKRIFVSDIHMSLGEHPYDWLDDDEATAFEQFLNYIAADSSFDELILVGDVMDDWVYPIHLQPPSYADIASISEGARPKIVDALKTIAQQRQVTYLVGNHDITITKNSVPDFGNGACPHIIFQRSYDVTGLWAEHGNQYTIWNALDTQNKLPVGHYISRLQATVDEGVGHPGRWQDAIAEILRNLDPTVKNPYVNIPLDYFVAKLGIKEDTNITTVDGSVITVAEVRELYADLSDRWKKGNHYFPGLIEQFLMEQSPLGLDKVAPLTAAARNKKVVIFGHTHMAKIEYVYAWEGPEILHTAIYANCGAWCQKNPYTYVIDAYDENAKQDCHTVTLMNWPEKKPVKTPLSI
jgi:UDP-2,3-diacylglucosamine pyrophosphatase LpxH